MTLWIIKVSSFALVLCAITAQAQTLPVRISPVNSSDAGTCKSPPPSSKINEIRTSIRSDINPYLTQRYGPLRDCGGPGWTKVVSVNMSASGSTCPTGFTERNSPVRSCGRSGDTAITTTTFDVGHPYSHVCGRILAFQKGETEAFRSFVDDNDPLNYVDGINIRYGGQRDRNHIWTFAAGRREAAQENNACPCIFENWNFQLPSFIGSNYFCETGNGGERSATMTFLDDPLWDGKGCVTANCCNFNDPPWFFRELPQPTTDIIRFTLILDHPASDENIFIQEIELYASH